MDNGLSNGQAQTGMSGAAAGFVNAVEAFANVRQVLRRNAGAGVPNRDCGRVFVSARANANLAVIVVVVDGIGKEVSNDLGEAVGVALADSGSKVGMDADAALRGERLNQSEAV